MSDTSTADPLGSDSSLNARRESFLAGVERLSPGNRRLMLYRGLVDCSNEATAALLGLTPDVAARRWSRLRRRLAGERRLLDHLAE